MTNFEKLMAVMTPEALAEITLRMVNVDNRRLYYMTSTGQLYNLDEYNKALAHEYNWLTNNPDVTDEQACKCGQCENDIGCDECAECGEPDRNCERESAGPCPTEGVQTSP